MKKYLMRQILWGAGLLAMPGVLVASDVNLNQIDYKQWSREPFNEQSSFGEVGVVYLVKNVRLEYKPKPGVEVKYRDEDLIKLTGDIFINPKGNLEMVVVIYDTDQHTSLLAAYVEDQSQMDNLDLQVFYWAKGRWKKVSKENIPLDLGPELFWHLYQQTGKLLHFVPPSR